MTRPSRRFLHSRSAFLLVASILVFFGSAPVAYAGFGVTPPYVDNDRLTRGTVFEQRITLVRSDPTDDLKGEITMNIPGAEDWFSVDVGKEFTLPKGVMQVPIVVTVRVPKDAPFKDYSGSIRVRTSSANAPTGGGVSIALGAQIDVAIKVVDKIYDFDIRRIRMADLEEGRTKWGLFFPGKIRFFMTVQNTGNTDFGPTRVHFDIYDSEMETLLESVDNTNNIEKVTAFGTKEVVAELPTRLPAGRYMAKYTIYKNSEIAQQNTVNVSITAPGAVAGYEGYGFDGLSTQDKIKAFGMFGTPIILLLILLVILFVKRTTRRNSRTTLR